MNARHVYCIRILASIFAAFVVYLCVSLVDITPMLIIIAVCTMAVAFEKPIRQAAFTAIKLTTQKAE